MKSRRISRQETNNTKNKVQRKKKSEWIESLSLSHFSDSMQPEGDPVDKKSIKILTKRFEKG